jgi:hypothetical protein
MQKRCGKDGGAFFIGHRLANDLLNARQESPGVVHHADGMCESTVIRAGANHFAHPKLLDSPQPLEFRCVDQFEKQAIPRRGTRRLRGISRLPADFWCCLRRAAAS